MASTKLKLPLPLPNGVGVGTTMKQAKGKQRRVCQWKKIVKNYSMSVSWKGDKTVFFNAMRVRCICFNYKI